MFILVIFFILFSYYPIQRRFSRVNIVTKCQKLNLSSNLLMLCNHLDQRYGTTCKFNCYPGYTLVGPRQIYCDKNGKWSRAPPVCDGMLI